MQVERFTKLKDNRYKVSFKDNINIILYDDVIVKYNLLINKKLDSKTFMELTSYNDSLTAYYKSLKYLNIKMRSKKELINYLKKLEFDTLMIDNTIKRLEKEGYLNENNFVKAFINDQINLTVNGPYKINKLLIELGISEDVVTKQLREVNDSFWNDRMIKCIEKKLNSKSNYSSKQRKEKITNYLVILGYEKHEVISYLSEIKLDNDKDLIEKEGTKILIKLKRKHSGYKLKQQLFVKMLQKGFEYDEINSFIEKI